MNVLLQQCSSCVPPSPTVSSRRRARQGLIAVVFVSFIEPERVTDVNFCHPQETITALERYDEGENEVGMRPMPILLDNPSCKSTCSAAIGAAHRRPSTAL